MNTLSKKDFKELLHVIIDATNKIDQNTVWQESEPEWWVDMMDLQRKAIALRDKHKSL